MTKLTALALACLLSAPVQSWADSRTFEGNIESNRGVVRIPLVLDTTLQNVGIWTDSFQQGLHFDPITALWQNGILLRLNDDDSNVGPDQSWFDSGMIFDSLASGSYLITITNYDNFPHSDHLADGFNDDDPAYPARPLNNCPAPDNCEGSFYRLHFQDHISTAPEPHAWQLLLGGLLLIGSSILRRRLMRMGAYNAAC